MWRILNVSVYDGKKHSYSTHERLKINVNVCEGQMYMSMHVNVNAKYIILILCEYNIIARAIHAKVYSYM